MIYIPDILNYKPFYIQTKDDAVAIDTTEWGLVAKSNPFPALPTPKEPYKNQWNDESGDDEYVEILHYKASEMEIGFYIKCFGTEAESADSVLRRQVDSFFEKIKEGEFMIYDSYTGIGRTKVRYAGFSEDVFVRRDQSSGDWARAIFKIKFKINDPLTRVSLVNGALVVAE